MGQGAGGQGEAGTGVMVTPFAPDDPAVYVAKVKNVLLGLPPTDDEVKSITADPTKFGDLVKSWMAKPEYESKMLSFFELAFQQTQIQEADFDLMLPRGTGIGKGQVIALLMQNVQESFARTVLELVKQGEPLSKAFTTHQFMMTPPLMELYAYLDTQKTDDLGKQADTFATELGSAQLTLEAGGPAIPIAQSIDPSNGNYMHWNAPALTSDMTAGCQVPTFVVDARGSTMHAVLYGGTELFPNPAHPDSLPRCGAQFGPISGAYFKLDDFSSWKMVTVRAPNTGEATTRFYDLTTLQSTNELVLNTPRVGFFTTPAFFANWQTNQSNQMRVTANQALIVATGAQYDGTNPIFPKTTPGLDPDHSAPDSACFSCHASLDPTRSIFGATYSWSYAPVSSNKNDQPYSTQKGLFAFDGVTAEVNSLDDFAAQLAAHPAFASGWVQKLCYYVNSEACATDDPEFQRLVALFKSSNYDWSTLVESLLASPLTTNATETKSAAENGVTVAVVRQGHLCDALNARLNLTDVCGLDLTKVTSANVVAQIAGGLPSDGYGRGAVAPVLPNQPGIFYRTGVENICESVATQLIDAKKSPPGAKTWSSDAADAAIADFVATMLGLTASDPRAATALAALKKHYSDAVAMGTTKTVALQSTFVVTCLAPTFVGMGM